MAFLALPSGAAGWVLGALTRCLGTGVGHMGVHGGTGVGQCMNRCGPLDESVWDTACQQLMRAFAVCNLQRNLHVQLGIMLAAAALSSLSDPMSPA